MNLPHIERVVFLKLTVNPALFTKVLRSGQKHAEKQAKYELSVPINPFWMRELKKKYEFIRLLDEVSDDYIDAKVNRIIENRGNYLFLLGDLIDTSRTQGRKPQVDIEDE